jgi:outer membrane protein TolC
MGLSYEKNRQSFSTLETETVFSFTSGMLAPVFDAGRLKASVSQRKAEAVELLAILEQAVLVAVREVEDALERELSMFDKQKFLRNEISIARETVNKARLRYVNGKESYLTVLSSLEDLQNLQVEEIELQQELLINRCRLLKALGVKWSH